MASGVFASLEVGGKHFHTLSLDLGGAPLLIVKGSKGYVACGYIDMRTAEALGDACALVTGVKTFEDVLKAKIVAVSEAARYLGLGEGMTAKEALEKLA